MSDVRRRWAFGSWSSVITVFTVLTVVVLSIWLMNQSGDGAPRPQGNNDFPVQPEYVSPMPTDDGSSAPAIGSRPSSPSPTSPSPTPPKTTPPSAPKERLHAAYSAEIDWLNNVESTVRITNPSKDAIKGWTVVLVLPKGMTVESASGAQYQVDGRTVTFTPDGNGTVAGHGSVEFTFYGAGPHNGPVEPDSCSVNGKPCG